MAGLAMSQARPVGETFGQRRPPLYQMIANILREYPSGQIFKEIIQNADDARATEVKFYLDCRHVQTLPQSLVENVMYNELDRFQGPALMSFNNAPFKKEDWDSIQSLQQSGKAKNPHKVGKFGIGFNSVYHITDLPVIISEDYCGFLEPQEHIWKGESGKGYYLKDVRYTCPDLVRPFDGVGDFSKLSPSFDGKTLFRFPLRNRASNLSKEVYTVEKLKKLLIALEAEAKYLLLFLRSVCSIEVIEISELETFEQVFKVCISSHESTKHHSEQQLLLRRVESTFTGASPYAVKQVIQETAHFHIELNDGSRNEWVVVHRIGSENPKVLALAEKQHVLPWVGTAFEVSNTNDCSKGRIFCFLPLPTEDRTPFAIHVNGTFAVSSNRRSLKWEAQERRDDQEGTWNKLLVQYCLPHCYAQLIQELIRLPSLPHKIVYNCWPSMQLVQNTPWEGILKNLFETILLSDSILYTEANNGQWISLAEAIFVPKAGLLNPAVKKLLLLCGANVVELSTDQWKAIDCYYTRSISIIEPSYMRNFLRQNPNVYNHMSYKEKLDILEYCLLDSSYSDLNNLELIPLVNGHFATFSTSFVYSPIYICSPSIRYDIVPGVEHMIVDLLSNYPRIHAKLTNVVNSNVTQLKMLGVREVAQLLPQLNSQSWSQQQLEKFWKWLQNYDLGIFQSTCIVPVKHSNGSISIQTLNKQAEIVYLTRYVHYSSTSPLKTALEKFGIKLASAHDFPYLSHQQITKFLYKFEAGEVIDAIPLYSLTNAELTDNEACALQEFIAATRTSFTNTGRINKICAMSIFSVIQHHSVRYSLNTLKTNGVGNKAVVQGDHFEFRTDLLPGQPLIINTNNNSKMLQMLGGRVKIMNGMEFLENVVFPKIICSQFPDRDLTHFMKSVLDSLYVFLLKFPQSQTSFLKAISTLPFVTVDSGERKSPSTLFDPTDELISQLYQGEPVFPHDEYEPYINHLHHCGLRTMNSVTATDIYNIICTIQPFSNASTVPVQCSKISYSRMVTLLKVLNKYPDLIYQNVKVIVNGWMIKKTLKDAMIERARSYQYLPVTSDPPLDYPQCLTWKASMYTRRFASSSSENIISHSKTLNSADLYWIVGSQAIFVENVPFEMCQSLSSSKSELAVAVVNHFEHVINNETEIESHILEQIAFQTYRYLGSCSRHVINLRSLYNWVWVESYSTFFNPKKCALQLNPSFRFNIEPFIFVLSSRMQEFEKLLSEFGVVKNVTPVQILSVLQTIREQQHHISDHEARSTIKSILEWVVQNLDPITIEILVPIESDETYPQLLPSDEVAYTDNDMLLQIAESSDEEYKLVHSSVAHLAPQLGLTPLSDHLDITEEVFEDAGQHEPLTTRLSNILKEYKDGLTIIKEMIQNADDAEATEVNILYDARTHTTDKLFIKGMADSHGPALVVHNNSTFSEEDFTNITKLAGATKKDKPLKIGKFGVGFCSVYHITDVPSFVSGEWLYIFDPTLKHLKGIVKNENQPGKRMKYMSKFISKSQQLVPYQSLFGFDTSKSYNGTMFRFPFRKNASQISSTIYEELIVNELREDLAKHGSRLLLFLNHVKKITFQSIRNIDDAPSVQLSIEMRDNSNGIRKVETHSFLSCNTRKETWLLSSHTEQLFHIYQRQYKQSVASVACQLTEESGQFRCQPLNEGSVFCFLPLSVLSTGLPVHVSANFAVMSNRSGIWTSTSSSSPSDSREWWNLKLMEIVIPKAYCNLLKLLKELHNSNKLVEYDFFALLPLSEQLLIKQPWQSLIYQLYQLISKEDLFHSSATNQWLTLYQSRFLSPNILLQIGSRNIPQCVTKAVDILQLPVVYLPTLYLVQLQQVLKGTLHMINQIEFSQVFFQNIFYFDDECEIRNNVLFSMFLTVANELTTLDESQLMNILQNNPCIPCTPNGQKLKHASQLVDPSVDIHELFDSDSGMFPINVFCQRTSVRQVMVAIGLLTSKLPWDMVVKCAKSIHSVYQKDEAKALRRVQLIISCIEENIKREQEGMKPTPRQKSPYRLYSTSYNVKISLLHIPQLQELKRIPFIPVVPKPDGYFLSWKGQGLQFSCPSQMFYSDRRDLKKNCFMLGSQNILVNTELQDNGGCGNISRSVHTHLGFQTMPSLKDVLRHFICLIDTFEASMVGESDKSDTVEYICRILYEFLNNYFMTAKEIEKTDVLSEAEKILIQFRFIWTGNCFTSPQHVARHWTENGPYLFQLPPMLSERKSLTKVLRIDNRFSIKKLISTLAEMYQQFGNEKLPQSCHKIVDAILHELNRNTAENLKDLGELDVFLPDKSYTLHPATELSLNDSPWLPVDRECVLVHSTLNRDKVLCLGVKAIRSKFLDKYATGIQKFGGIPFGQQEELTQRIVNILRDYPLDVTLLKELLQNADDAKATKMYVILDKRTHGKQRIPSSEWEELQGPALLVWDDANFEEKDIEGIQKLGLGSKRDDSESIGHFGIGFNVVYHITDCPSFITGGKTLCIFDPHCYYIQGADVSNPGRRFNNLEEDFWVGMSDLRNAYLQDEPIPNQPSGLQTGSLFRFPLRYTKQQILKSEIIPDKVKTEPLTAERMELMLNQWVPMIKEALLFLNNVTEFHYYVIDDQSNDFQLKVSYEVNLDAQAKQSRDDLLKSLQEFKDTKEPHIVTFPLCIESKEGKCLPKMPLLMSKVHCLHQEYATHKEKWLIQQGVGDILNHSQEWRYIDQVLPKHGIAASLDTPDIQLGKIFCFLPLPGRSGLPVHINGQFVLSSNRRSLWSGDTHGQDEKKEWNDKLLEAVSSSYVHFLTAACDFYVSTEGYEDKVQFYNDINRYYKLFPFWQASTKTTVQPSLNPNCKVIAQSVFKKLWSSNSHILASEVFVKRSNDRIAMKAQWNVLNDDKMPFHQAHFLPVNRDIILILRRIRMVLTCAPYRLYNHLSEYRPAIADPASVYEFYCRCHSHILQYGCPCDIEKTPFKTKENFVNFLRYIFRPKVINPVYYPAENQFPDSPYGYPLLLTADNYLRCFNDRNKVMRSSFTHLFSNSLSLFLAPTLLVERMCSSYFVVPQDVEFHTINSLIEDNFPLELKQKNVDNSDGLLNMETLKTMWKCISSEKDILFSKHQKSIVNSWAFLPATNKHLYSASSEILPIMKPDNMHMNVVNTFYVRARDTGVLETFHILNRLGIPVLDTTITNPAVTKYCPKMTDYDLVLSVLFHMHDQYCVLDNLSTSNSDVNMLLSYLSRTNYRHDPQIKDMIKALPLFESIQWQLTVLKGKKVYLWPLGFCSAGYNKWAPSDTVVFLHPQGSWKRLCGNDFSFLGLQLNGKDIYSHIIFPQFNKLNADERRQHLLYIKNNIYPHFKFIGSPDQIPFVTILKELKCLESPVTAQLLPVNSFSDHRIPIFTTFPKRFLFLSEDYRKDEWIDFFHFLGLRDTVTFDEYISFCEQVSENKHKDVGNASNVLINYLFSEKGREWCGYRYYLSKIGGICFVKIANLKYFSWIRTPCQSPREYPQLDIGLTKLNQAVVFDHASLVWTVKPVVKLPPNNELRLNQQDYFQILEGLGVTTSPNTNDVYQNILNISNTNLSNFTLFSTYNEKEYTDKNTQACPSDIMIENILYLQNKKGENLLKMLNEVPCIPLCAESSLAISPKKTVLVKPIEVVQQLLPGDENLVPYINQKPSSMYQIDVSLRIMGVCDHVGLKHIQHMLQKIHHHYKTSFLGPNEVEKVRCAVLKLGQLLANSRNTDNTSQELIPLFLPSPTGYDWHLINSTELVFIDSTRYISGQFNFVNAPYSLFQIPPDTRPKFNYGHRFRNRPLLSTGFVDTSQSERNYPKEMTEKDLCLRLPKQIRPKGISFCSYEKVVLLNAEDTDSSLSQHMQNLKPLLEQFKQIFPDIVSHYCLPDTQVEPFLSRLMELINNLCVTVAVDLKAGVFSDAQLTNRIATICPDFVLQEKNNAYTLYVAKKATASSVTLMTELSRSLCIAVAKILQFEGTTFLKLIPAVRVCIQQQCNEDIQSLCKELKIQLQHEQRIEEKEEGSFLPKLGHSIPKELHYMLDTDINHIFRPQEWVGYEEAEENFVWAIVLYPVQEQNGAVPEPIMKRYLIQYNEQNDEGKTVPAVDLYKFITIVTAEGQELVLVDDTNSNTIVTQPCDSQKLKEMKRKICQELLLLWKLPSKEEKKKAIRRMYLKYHPDKAKPDERGVYEDAFKFMLRQIDRLESGLSIEDPDEETMPDVEEIHESSSWTQHYRQWNTYVPMHSWSRGNRGRSERGTSWGHFNFFSFQTETSPVEADRWLRQAWSDCKVMQLLLRTNSCLASCQVIFLAHEVIEKALKAGMYKLVGLNPRSLVSHELYSHAQAICSQRIWTEPSISLTEIAINMSPYYSNSRFPNKHPLPKAPVDVYDQNEAKKAALYAEMVIKFINEIVE